MDGAPSAMPRITGRTVLLAHLGFPTESFKAPMIYNPWFEKTGIDAVVIDNAGVARRMTDHLIALGHRRIGMVTGRPDGTGLGLSMARGFADESGGRLEICSNSPMRTKLLRSELPP